MTARQQFVRLLPLVLLLILVIAGLRGTVPAPGWNGPLKAYGVAIGLALEVILGVLMLAVRRRDAAAVRAAEWQAGAGAGSEPGPPEALRFVLRYVLGLSMLGVGLVLLSNLREHFFLTVAPLKPPRISRLRAPGQSGAGRTGAWTQHIPLGTILYGLLIIALIAAIAISVWWSSRLRRPVTPLVIADVDTGELREAVESGRIALAAIDDARAAIIACYAAMERSLADRGAARGAAETPDELLVRAVAAGVVRGDAASRLTALFYEARFSTHPVTASQRAAAGMALDELAGGLAAPAAGAALAGGDTAGPGGGWV